MRLCFRGTTGEPFDGSVVNGIYRTGSLGHYSVKDVDTVNKLINQYTEEGIVDDILAIFMAPQICINAIKGDDSNRTEFKLPLNKGDIFGGYTPRNNKLYSYPFCYAMVDNNEVKRMSTGLNCQTMPIIVLTLR